MRWYQRDADPRSHAGHEMRIDRLEKKKQPEGVSWAVASFLGEITSGTNELIEYDQFVTSDPDVFSMTSGRLHTLEDGSYQFFSNAVVYPSGSPALSTEVTMSTQVTAESSHTIALGFQWPFFGLQTVTGYNAGTRNWSPFVMEVRTYNDDNISFPTDYYVLMTVPFTTLSGSYVSTLAVRLSDSLPLDF